MIILYILLAWLLFNIVTKFVIPVYRTTRMVKKQFNEMRNAAQQAQGQQSGQTYNNEQQAPPKKAESLGEYIEFEEVK